MAVSHLLALRKLRDAERPHLKISAQFRARAVGQHVEFSFHSAADEVRQ
jgi:hypothetical protein